MPIAAGLYYFLHEAREDAEKRPPMILIHGAGGNHLSWAPQIRRMDVGKIYALDLPGHGKSEGVGKQSIDEYAGDVIAFMKEMNINSAVMAGVSMGGAIALSLALKYPRKVRGLVLIGSGAKLRVAPEILESTGNANTFESAVDMVNINCFSENVSPALLELSKRHLMQIRPPVLEGDFIACNEFNVIEDLPKIQKRALVICGAEDKMTPIRYSQFLKENLPNAEIHIIEGAGHMAMLEQPEQVAALLEAFIKVLPVRKRKKKAEEPSIENRNAILSGSDI